MFCSHCGYILFNLRDRLCPECGRPHSLTQYWFDPGAVEFHCPHCNQEYFGNDPQGLPEPKQFTCVQCGNPVALDQMVVVPRVEGAMGRMASGTPWDNRRKIGLVSAWWQTVKLLIREPTKFFQGMVNFSILPAWLFAAICTVLGMMMHYAIQFLVFWVTGQLTARGAGPGFLPFFLIGAVFGLSFGSTLGVIVGAAINAVLYRIGLLMVKHEKRPFEHTMCIALYASAGTALLFIPIPILNALAAVIVTIVITAVGIRELHRTTTGAAIWCIFWPAAAVIVVGLLLLAIYLVVANL